VDLVVSVFAVTVDGVFAVECVVFFERFDTPEAVGIDGQRLLLAIPPAAAESSITLPLPPGSRTVCWCRVPW